MFSSLKSDLEEQNRTIKKKKKVSSSHHDSPDPVPETKRSSKATYSKKIGDGLGKTKAIASTGVKKVKEGTAVGLHWIRDKYQKN